MKHEPGGRFVNLILAHRYLALLFGVAVIVGLGAGIPRVTSDFTYKAFFDDGDPRLKRVELFEQRFGNDDYIVIAVHSPSGIFDPESIALLHDLTERVWKVPRVIRVESLSNFSWVRAVEDDIMVAPLLPDDHPITPKLAEERRRVALDHELLPGYLVSPGGKTAMIYGALEPAFGAKPIDSEIVDAARKAIAEVQSGDHSFHLAGGPVLGEAMKNAAARNQKVLLPIVFVLALVLLFALLRTLSGVVLPVLAIVGSIVATNGAAGWLGLELSVMTSVVPVLLVSVSIADCVHIFSTFYRRRGAGDEKLVALRGSLTENLKPTLLTSVSTAVGFVSFLSSDLPPISTLGLLSAIGTVVAWLTTYLVIAPLLAILPSRVPKPRRQVNKRLAPRFVGFLQRRSVAVITVFILACAVSAAVASKNEVDTDPYNYFRDGSPIKEAQRLIIAELGGVPKYELSIETPGQDGVKNPEFLLKVEEFERRAVRLDTITAAISIVDILKQMHRSLHGDNPKEYRVPSSPELVAQLLLLYSMSLPQGTDVNNRVTVDFDALRLTLLSPIKDQGDWARTRDELQAIADDIGIDVVFTGKSWAFGTMGNSVTLALVRSVLIAVCFVSLLMVFAFRSLWVGFLALLPNIVPLILGAGILQLLGQPLNIGTVMVCSICLGIAVDDTIHLMTAIRERSTQPSPVAITEALSHTAPALVVTTVVLVCSFGVLAFASFVPTAYFGIMSAVILTGALVTDVTFLPALLLTFSRRALDGDADEIVER